MFFKLLLAFTLIPVTELALLIWLGSRLGFWQTLAIVIITGITGASLAKWQGFKVWNEIQSEMSQGHMPASRLIDGAFIFVAGLLMLTPGFLTDIAGVLLLVPPVRACIKERIRRWLQEKIRRGQIRMSLSGFEPPLEPPSWNGDGDSQPGQDQRDRWQ